MSYSLDPTWTVARLTPLSVEFTRQEYWSRFLFLLQGNLSDPVIKPVFLGSPGLAGGFFTTVPPGKPELKQSSSLMVTSAYRW